MWYLWWKIRIRIILYAARGILTLAVLKQVVILIPFMLAGVFLGMKSSSVLNEKVDQENCDRTADSVRNRADDQ